MSTGIAEEIDYINGHAEAFTGVEDADLDSLMERIDDAPVVLLGEATHGTSEFYRMRHRITRRLIEEKGFNIVALEADWPDAEHVDEYIRQRNGEKERKRGVLSRFPSWMWRNAEFLECIETLRGINATIQSARERVSVHGLDLYSLYSSIHEVLEYFEREDPEAGELARQRYACMLPFEPNAQEYGSAVVSKRHEGCGDKVVAMLRDLLEKRLAAEPDRRESLFDPEQNSRVVAGAERYYRAMFRVGRDSWNIRDTHMFDTLKHLLEVRGPAARVVVWAHNSHIGDARATDMGKRGEVNIGSLCRAAFGDGLYTVGFGTGRGTVAAADDWGGRVKIKNLKPPLPGSHGEVCEASGVGNFLLPLRSARRQANLAWPDERLERAVGVVYRPDSERGSHYFSTDIANEYDELIWLDKSEALEPLTEEHAPTLAERHPFLLGD